jgi:hypothetical protein
MCCPASLRNVPAFINQFTPKQHGRAGGGGGAWAEPQTPFMQQAVGLNRSMRELHALLLAQFADYIDAARALPSKVRAVALPANAAPPSSIATSSATDLLSAPPSLAEWLRTRFRIESATAAAACARRLRLVANPRGK